MRRALAIAALVAGGLAAIAGEPAEKQLDVESLAAVVEREEDHVDALELARWIRQRKPGLRVIDLRDPDAFDEYHVPSARNMSLPLLVKTPFDRADTIVLISEGGAHAAQAWVFLRARGHQRAYFLRGGLQEWMADVMNPAGARGEQAELSRYFGGVPRIEGDEPMTASELRRRGC